MGGTSVTPFLSLSTPQDELLALFFAFLISFFPAPLCFFMLFWFLGVTSAGLAACSE